MAVITKDLGAVSAYAIAVEHGYTGTEEEFAQEIANASANAQAAAQSATEAAGSATAAAGSATSAAADSASASGSATSAESSAQSALSSKNAAQAAQAAAETAKTAAETAKTAAQTAAATAAAAYGTDLLADDYSTSGTYAVGDYVIYSGDLYRCTTAITTAEAWTAAHWTLVQVGTELGGLKSALNNDAVVCKSNISGITALSEVRTPGVYGISGTVYNACTDKPSGATSGVKTLIVYTKTYSNHIIQILLDVNLYKYERILNPNGDVYKDWIPKTDTTLTVSGVPADASTVGSQLNNVGSQLNDFVFYRPNPANILKNTIFYSVDDSIRAFRHFKFRNGTVELSEENVPDSYGKGVKGISASIVLDYLLPIEDIETDSYTVTLRRFGANSYNGRLTLYYVNFPGSGRLAVYGSAVILDPQSGIDPTWIFDIDKEAILEAYPNTNAILLEWNNTSLETSYYSCPMMCKTSTVDKSFFVFNENYTPIDELFEPGLYEEQEIEYEETDGYYSFAGTAFNEYSRVHTSTLIPVTNQNVRFTGTTWAQVPALVYFNASQVKIGCYPASKLEPLYTNYTDEDVVIPSEVAYIRIQDVHDKQNGTLAPVLYFSTGEMAKEANHALTADSISGTVYDTTHPLYGKKLVTAGDSYTHAQFGDANYNGKNYGYYVAQRHNMTFINSGISGSIMALDKTYVADPDNVSINTRQPFSYQRYQQVPADTDYLTIWFGINDAANTNLGTISDETNETFYGAWNIVLRYFLTNYPFMKIGLVVTTGANADYRQAVRDVAAKWGYPVLDWVQDTSIPAFFDRDGMSTEARTLRRAAYGYNDYSGHPNPQWHEYASTIYEKFLMSL